MKIGNLNPNTQNQVALNKAIALEPELVFAGTDLREFKYCCEFLSARDETTKPNSNMHSYDLKHYIEKYADSYVSNSALIAAAMHLGIKYRRIPNTPNVLLAISKKSLPKLPSSPRLCPMF